MNNDLISREALKEACSEMVRGSNNSDFIPCPSWNDAMELIDNAPTVDVNEPTLNESIAFHNGYELGKVDRPHGKWIIADVVSDYYHECPFCHWRNTVTSSLENYCPNCGADMRGEEE